MLTSSVRIKLIAFVIVGLLATAYLGARYAGISLVSRGYQVTFDLPDAGGLFVNGEVTYLGVPVGKITAMTPTSAGVEVTAKIDSGAPQMPAHPTVSVADRSVIGEQYLELTGKPTGTTFLAAGDHIQAADATLPPDLAGVLQDATDFTGSVPRKDLKTVINESYNLSNDASGPLRQLVNTSAQFEKQANDNWLVSQALIQDSSTVLSTQESSAADIAAYSKDLDLIAKTLKSSNGNLTKLIDDSPAAARQVGDLINQVGVPLGTLMGNLTTTAQIFGTNADGLHDILVRAPEAISIGWAVNGSQGLNLGLAPTFFNPLPCTKGYQGTTMRTGTDTTTAPPLNLQAGCTASPATGSDVMGPTAVPGDGALGSGNGGTGGSGGSGGGAATANVTVATTLADLLGGAQ